MTGILLITTLLLLVVVAFPTIASQEDKKNWSEDVQGARAQRNAEKLAAMEAAGAQGEGADVAWARALDRAKAGGKQALRDELKKIKPVKKNPGSTEMFWKSGTLTKREFIRLKPRPALPSTSVFPDIVMSEQQIQEISAQQGDETGTQARRRKRPHQVYLELYEDVTLPWEKDGKTGTIVLRHTGLLPRRPYGKQAEFIYRDELNGVATDGLIETGDMFVQRVEIVKGILSDNTFQPTDLVPVTEERAKEKLKEMGFQPAKPPTPRPKPAPKVVDLIPLDLDPSEFRFSEQCFLIYNIKRLTEKLGKSWYSKKGSPENYFNLVGDPIDIMKKFRDKSVYEVLFSMKPYQLSMLVPKIKIYKVQYTDEEAFKRREGEDVELYFDDFTREQLIEQMVSGPYGRGSSVGLKSFQYTYDGKHPGEAKTVINGVLDLHFQNFASLVGGVGDVDTYERKLKEAKDKPMAQFIDLIWAPSTLVGAPVEKRDPCDRFLETHDSKKYNPQFFEIKVVVGWAVPDDPNGEIFNAAQQKAISASKEVLFLSLRDHDIAFNQDGTINISIKYIGRIEGMLRTDETDLFAPSRITAEVTKPTLKGINEKLSDVCKELRKEQKRGDNKDSKKIEKLEEENKELQKKKREANFASRAKKFSTFLKKLSDKTYYVDLDSELLARYMATSNKDLIAGADLHDADSKGKYATLIAKTLKQQTEIKVDKADPGESTKALERRVTADAKGVKKGPFGKEERVELNKTLIATTAKDPKRARVNFFFLGDLIKIAAGSIPGSYKTGIVLGPLEMVEPSTGKHRLSVPMAKVPISMNLFQSWFVENVLKYDRRKYTVDQFISDVITSLILPATGPRCIGGTSNSMAQLIGDTISVPRNLKESVVKGTNLLKAKNLPTFEGQTHKSSKGWHHYLLLTATQRYPKDLNGERAKDFARGIYHLNLGQDAGLVKEINFVKSDQPFLQEVFMTQNMQLGQVQRLYSADVKLFGNTCFDLGQLVYLDPNFPGMGSPRQRSAWSRVLGLGGYYRVIHVGHELDRNGYQTALKCLPEDVFSKRERDEAGKVVQVINMPEEEIVGKVPSKD